MTNPEILIEKNSNNFVDIKSEEINNLLEEYYDLSLDDKHMIEFNDEMYNFFQDKSQEPYKKTELYHKLIGSQLDKYEETPFEFYEKVKDFINGFKNKKGIK